MTSDAISGEWTAYYPDGRASQRPRTLEPAAGEDPQEVVASLRSLSVELDHAWDNLGDQAWEREVTEPADNPDLGTLRVSGLPLLRLTEVEVHGTDLGLGLDDWSDLFVKVALPARLGRHWVFGEPTTVISITREKAFGSSLRPTVPRLRSR